jgi:hypothetical protein
VDDENVPITDFEAWEETAGITFSEAEIKMINSESDADNVALHEYLVYRGNLN